MSTNPEQSTEGFEPSAFSPLAIEAQTTTIVGARLASPTTVYLKVEVPATADEVTVSFNPVSMEEIRQTKELNRSVRLGFSPPTVSTR